MRIRTKLVVLAALVLFGMALSIVPRIIEARWAATSPQGRKQEVASGVSIRNDTSIPLREMKQKPYDGGPQREANTNPPVLIIGTTFTLVRTSSTIRT